MYAVLLAGILFLNPTVYADANHHHIEGDKSDGGSEEFEDCSRGDHHCFCVKKVDGKWVKSKAKQKACTNIGRWVKDPDAKPHKH